VRVVRVCSDARSVAGLGATRASGLTGSAPLYAAEARRAGWSARALRACCCGARAGGGLGVGGRGCCLFVGRVFGRGLAGCWLGFGWGVCGGLGRVGRWCFGWPGREAMSCARGAGGSWFGCACGFGAGSAGAGLGWGWGMACCWAGGARVRDWVPLLREVLDQAGLGFDEIDYVIPHQTSARAIKKGIKQLSESVGGAPKHVVVTVDELGNTASTTHFVALRKYLREGRFVAQDRVMLLSLASGLEVGFVIFKVDQLVGRYGHDH
jgi:hypothetical protein